MRFLDTPAYLPSRPCADQSDAVSCFWLSLARSVRDRKLILHRIDSHALLCSSAVLALLPSLPPSVPGGQILLSPLGDPTGVFLDNAMDLVETLRGGVTALERQRWLTVVGRDAVSKGLVGVHDAGTVFEEIDFYRKCVPTSAILKLGRKGEDVFGADSRWPGIFLLRQAAKGSLPFRIYSMIMCPDQSVFCGDDVERVGWETYDGRFRVEGVKLISDGSYLSHYLPLCRSVPCSGCFLGVALMIGRAGLSSQALSAVGERPCTSRTRTGPTAGGASCSPTRAHSKAWWTTGFGVVGRSYVRPLFLQSPKLRTGQVLIFCDLLSALKNVHAIGDLANSLVLSAFAPHLPSSAPLNPLRLRIEHAQILTLPALAEVVAKGVIASYQPTHGTSDMGYAEDRMGSRIEGAYKWRSVVDGGGRISTLSVSLPLSLFLFPPPRRTSG